MRTVVVGVCVGLVSLLLASVGNAEERKSDRILEGVVSGLLGVPQQSPEATYTAQERDRLVSLLAGGQYATSRQGEPVDLMVYGVPLTQADHVYSARPVQPSQTARH